VTLHAIIEYLKYRIKAKGRHGTHSPFVYALVDQVLSAQSPISFKEKLQNHFPDFTITYPVDRETMLPVKNNHVILILENIHQNKEHSLAWQTLCNDARVKMSIDMYTYGMLLFLDEFKEKQHFVLKYSG
jgi:hypothetical protein